MFEEKKMFNTDKPINSKKEDLLDRADFSDALANAILSYKNTDNFTISLCGDWGSGKSSILKMTIDNINNKTSNLSNELKPLIIEFNPWNYSSAEQLISQFFAEILSELKQNNSSSTLNQIGNAIEKYSDIIDYTTYIPVVGKYLELSKFIFKGAGKTLKEIGEEKNSIANQKKKVIKSLKSLKQKIIIIIDDIDRLNNQQIKLIFQLVNSVANFPNMIYLLSFDKSVVIRALEDEQKCSGEEYLEKIIQVPFNIPQAKTSLIHKNFTERLNKILDTNEQNYLYWDTVFDNCISPFIKNVRDINRILNVFSFKYNILKKEVCWIDLLTITVLEIYANEIYKWIINNIFELTNQQLVIAQNYNDRKEIKEKYLKEFSNIYKQPDLMFDIICTIFPLFAQKCGGNTYIHSSNPEKLHHDKRIACPERSNVYFNLSLTDIVINDIDMQYSIKTYSKNELFSYAEELIKKGILYEYLHELYIYISDIDSERIELFFDLLISLQTRAELYIRNTKTELLPAYECEKCVWQLLRRISDTNIADFLIQKIDSASTQKLYVLSTYIYNIKQAFGQMNNSEDSRFKIISKEELLKIDKSILNMYEKMITKESTLNIENFWAVQNVWKTIDQNSFYEHIKLVLQKPLNILIYLFANSGKEINSMINNNFNRESLEKLVSCDTLYKRIMEIKETEEFKTMDIRLKRIAAEFYIWYNKINNQNISTKSVNDILNIWENSNT